MASLLYARAMPEIGGTFADRVILTFAAAAVPEPASWGMAMLGFGLAGAALRHRTRRATMAA
ncbi:PEPxxWA-CTERM sorting domain-containing protein [Sphingomonas bacterium]|uniref:PEPxxWA-CTERM sorting domain-containing protein n=1 Tax=Sphingomonas bacterium TaxID=1895847 RepID=UPI0020C73FBD|nr:PEPxxWA-CTERM sorting domain-containing protein [Sphingomonas bacterium]